MRNPIALTAVILALGSVSPVTAQVVLDQNQAVADGFFGHTNSWSAQTFQTTANNIAGGGFYLHFFSDISTDYTIQLWDRVASEPGATMLASGTATGVSNSAGTNAWVDVFWNAVAVTPGSRLYLNVIGADGGAYTQWAGQNIYANGEAFYNYSTDPRNPNSCCGDYYDLTFRTYTDQNGPTGVVPEPKTLVLLGTGLVGLAGLHRRKQRGVEI
jgi:hypothetical protein